MTSAQNVHPFKSIAITGASRGLGAALAEQLAASGVTLFLSARSHADLETVAEQCRKNEAIAHCTALDVRDRAAVSAWIAASDAVAPLDLVIANAGISAGTGGGVMGGEIESQVDHIFAVNVHGVFNTITPAIAAMRPRGAGHIAIVSSLAGFRGMPGAPAYCASKAAVKSYGEGLRGHLAPSGLHVSVICPGFVETDMTAANDFPMPFMVAAPKAARIIVRGLRKRKGRIAFPLPMVFGAWFLDMLPDGVAHFLSRNAPAKPSSIQKNSA